MQAMKKNGLGMLFAPSFWRWAPAGLVVGVWCFAAAMVLHSCAHEPAPAARAPTKAEAMDRAADMAVLQTERAYEAMTDGERMKGVVYE